MARGGYREPKNPAPVSGPGKLSRRTDGGPTQAAKRISGGGKYGERKALSELQTSAPMQGNPIPNTPTPTVAAQAPASSAPASPLTKLFDPTQRPNEPLTAGMSFGDGYTPAPEQITGRFAMVSKYLPELNSMTQDPNAPESFKLFMQFVNAANRLDANNVPG
jgi:hypothetical protein